MEYKTSDFLEMSPKGYVDKYGVTYSIDRNFLIKAPKEIESYSIPLGTESICNVAFQNCEKLKFLYIPNTVKNIGDAAFDRCYSLSAVTIPESVEYLGFNIFLNCELESVLILSKFFLEEKCMIYSEDGTHLLCYYGDNKNVSIKSGTVFIDDYAFCGANVRQVEIPETVKTIGNQAFCACDELVELEIPNSVEEIGDGTFSLCENLKKLIIPENVKEIGGCMMGMKTLVHYIF